MKIISKSATEFIVIGDVPEYIKGILQRVWANRGDEQDRYRSNQFLKGVKNQIAWLMCDCTSDAVGNSPCMTVYKMKQGGYGLRRMPQRINHSQTCIFHWDPADKESRDEPDFLLFKPEKIESAKKATQPLSDLRVHYPKKSKQDTLKVILNWLLDAAGLNTLDGTSVQGTDRIGRLMRAAKEIELDNNLTLNQIVWTLPDALIKGWAAGELFKRQEAGHWPKNLPLQGYLIIPVKKMEGRVLYGEGDRKIFVQQPISNDGDPECSPRLAIVALRAEASRLVAEMAYTIPVRFLRHDRKEDGTWVHYLDLFPINNNTERRIADMLAKIARRMRGKGPNGEGITVEKPISISEVPSNAATPDFIVRVGQYKALIQVRTSAETEYVSRKDAEKKEMAKNLREEDRIFIDDRTALSTEACDELLGRRIMGWLRGELHFV